MVYQSLLAVFAEIQDMLNSFYMIFKCFNFRHKLHIPLEATIESSLGPDLIWLINSMLTIFTVEFIGKIHTGHYTFEPLDEADQQVLSERL